MCSKEEVEAAIDARIAPLEIEVGYVKDTVGKIEDLLNRTLDGLKEKVLRVSINQENIEKNRVQDRKDIDLLYGMNRENEKDIATLSEQNVGQDKSSTKTWALILIGVNFVFAIAIYFLTRG